MKKIQELLKPVLLIVFGALMFLLYLPYIQGDDAKYLVLGIFGAVFATYYVAVGVLNVTLGDKINANAKQIFDIFNVSLFAFLVMYNVIADVATICQYNADSITTTGWIINVFIIMAAGALIVMTIVSKTTNKPVLDRLTFMFAGLFGLALLLNVTFNVYGNPTALGNIVIATVALYAMFIPVMFQAIGKPEAAEQ